MHLYNIPDGSVLLSLNKYLFMEYYSMPEISILQQKKAIYEISNRLTAKDKINVEKASVKEGNLYIQCLEKIFKLNLKEVGEGAMFY